MVRRRLPYAFYLNSLAVGLYFWAVFVPQQPWHSILRWTGTVALLGGIVLMILKK